MLAAQLHAISYSKLQATPKVSVGGSSATAYCAKCLMRWEASTVQNMSMLILANQLYTCLYSGLWATKQTGPLSVLIGTPKLCIAYGVLCRQHRPGHRHAHPCSHRSHVCSYKGTMTSPKKQSLMLERTAHHSKGRTDAQNPANRSDWLLCPNCRCDSNRSLWWMGTQLLLIFYVQI